MNSIVIFFPVGIRQLKGELRQRVAILCWTNTPPF